MVLQVLILSKRLFFGTLRPKGAKLRSLILCLFISANYTYAKPSNYIPYVIQAEDNVSTVLQNHDLSPLYGDQKWVQKVLKLNRLTQESARKLEIGDVIIVPYKTRVMFSDDIKSIQSSIIKQIKTDYMSPKNYNFTLSGGYFNRNYTYTNQDNNVTLNQNFFLTTTYKERDPYSLTTFSYNPVASVSLYTQANANFNSDDSKVAEFTPSVLISAAIEIEHRETNMALAPTIEYENFSTLIFNGDEDYAVARSNQLWSGAQLSKSFYNNIYNPYIQISAAIGTLDTSSKYGTSLGINYKNHYQFEVSYNENTLSFDQKTQINDAKLTFGYRY